MMNVHFFVSFIFSKQIYLLYCDVWNLAAHSIPEGLADCDGLLPLIHLRYMALVRPQSIATVQRDHRPNKTLTHSSS